MLSRTFPEAVPDISAIATVLADRSRAAMCAALMDGRAGTVGELGAYAGLASWSVAVSPSIHGKGVTGTSASPVTTSPE